MPFPNIETCIVCEGVRQEILQKHILLGFFGIAPYVTVGVKDLAIPLNLCFVFCGSGGEGHFRLELRLVDATGVALANSLSSSFEGDVVGTRLGTNVFFQFQGLIPKHGRYRVDLLVDGKMHYSTSVLLGPFEAVVKS